MYVILRETSIRKHLMGFKHFFLPFLFWFWVIFCLHHKGIIQYYFKQFNLHNFCARIFKIYPSF